MGSFDYSDDYSSFDNLLNRTTLLTEGGRGLGGYHPGFGRSLTSRLKDAGSEAFTRDSRKFVVHILYGANILTDEEESMLRSAGPAGGKNYRLTLVQILDNHKDEIIERADEISDAIEERFPALANEILGRDPERIKNNISKRKVKLANKEIEKGIKSGEDPVDVITDEMEKVLANAAVYTALTNAQRKVSDRALDAVEKYAIEYVNSFSDLDKLINNLKTKFDDEDFNMLADELSNSLSSIRSNAGIGEDNEEPEEDPDEPDEEFANAPGGTPGSYARGEEGNETTSIVDSLNNDMRKKRLLVEKRKNWGKFRSNRRQKLVVEKDLNAAERRALPDSDFALPGKGKGPEGKQAGAYPINDEDHARNALARVAQHGTPEEKKKVRAAVARKYPDITQEEEEFNPRRDAPEHKEGDPHPATRAGEELIGTMVKFWRDGPMFGEVVDVDVEQGFAVVETGLGHMRVGPSEKWVVELGELTKAIRRKPRSTQTRFPETRPGRPGFRPAEDNKENTHKESYTSNYLSEQKSSDKRNIKPRTENQSFKERYKPKTHWQLEELRRMGL